MDFLKLLKSFEEFVYEAMLWLILLPKTLARIVIHPLKMTTYASAQLAIADKDRFNDAISPPLLLILCVLIAHFIDLGIRTQTPATSGSIASVILASDENLLLYRTIAFAIWALTGAACLLLNTGVPLGRESLRAPFYEQCYLVTPFALAQSLSVSLALTGSHHVIAGCMVLGMGLWFWLVQIQWIRRGAKLPLWQSLIAATLIVLIGAGVNALVGYALSYSRS